MAQVPLTVQYMTESKSTIQVQGELYAMIFNGDT